MDKAELNDLQHYDIVLTTYSILGNQWKKLNKAITD